MKGEACVPMLGNKIYNC